MPAEPSTAHAMRQAYDSYDQQVTVANVERGCLLGMSLMPAGFVLDLFVYPDKALFFFGLRVLCSLFIGIFWAIVRTEFGRRHYRFLGVTLAMIPSFFIAWMICEKDGASSPYYAGLNLVLLVVGFVLHWSAKESVISSVLVFLLYTGACALHGGDWKTGIFFNNVYFLFLTGLIVIVGSYYQSKLRLSEFASRFELDQNRQQLEASNQKLRELDEVKSRFFANISHELRTPLTLLLAPLETIIIQGRNSFTPDVQELLATMQANGMRLLKLINDLLDLVRLESGKMEVKLESLNVQAFVAGLIMSVKKLADDKRIQLVWDVAPEIKDVLIDRDKLEKIILNLVFNAVKFTPARGRVSLSVTKDGEILKLIVADTGMGIARENLNNVFNRFWQADTSSQRKYQGAGIGLALVKELVEVQGGTVQLHSEVHQGTTITIDFPYTEPDEMDATEAASAPLKPEVTRTPSAVGEEWLSTLYRRAELFPSLVSVKDSFRPVEFLPRGKLPIALIADDEPDMLRFLKSQLSKAYQVIEAVDGQQAIEKATQFLPEVILLDMMMPEKDGIQACRELRQNTSTQRIPIILLTARADDETKYAALAAGASDFLAKPFSSTELHVRIRNLINSHEFQRKLARQNQILEATLQQLKETETQLVQSEKLASLGRMSAGIIHEINNPLNFAKTAIHLLKRQGKELPEPSQDDYFEVLKDIEDGIDRVRNIVTDLRSFTHPNTENFEQVDLEEVLRSALRFLSNEWQDKVQLQIDLRDGAEVWGNRHQLVQVVLNLLQNALDALRKKPFVNGDKPSLVIEGVEKEGLYHFSVKDNGPGISAANVGRIFDPFFTTKDVGEGMGLGLSICYRIMQAHEGRIDVKSEIGEFTAFILEFPAFSSKRKEPELLAGH
ncbi:MAG: ATP-binding protein [Verrucomicrobiales bacterium]